MKSETRSFPYVIDCYENFSDSPFNFSKLPDSSLALQKAHVQQFVATEDALNKAAEAKALSHKLLIRLPGSSDVGALQMLPTGDTSQNVASTRHFEVLELFMNYNYDIILNIVTILAFPFICLLSF